MAQRIRWIGFCMSHALTRTLFHFFPSADNASAPYTAVCSLTLFGSGTPSKTIALDGARLGYPDGLRLEDAFPVLRSEGAGTFGLVIEMTSPQPRLDLGGSSCVVELVSAGQATKFWPYRVLEDKAFEGRGGLAGQKPGSGQGALMHAGGEAESCFGGFAFRDDAQRTSLLVVNSADKDFQCQIIKSAHVSGAVRNTEEVPQQALAGTAVNAFTAVEIPVDESALSNGDLHEGGWGSMRSIPIVVEFRLSGSRERNPSGGSGYERAAYERAIEPCIAVFMICRDATTRRVISVAALTPMSNASRGAVYPERVYPERVYPERMQIEGDGAERAQQSASPSAGIVSDGSQTKEVRAL